MRIAVIGASGAGLYAALFLSASTNHQVLLFDKNKVIGKKLLATGNGHCNLLPGDLDPERYSDPSAFSKFLGDRNLGDLKNALESLGIVLTKENGLYYPASYHAPTHVRFLEKSLRKNGVEMHLDEKVIDYQNRNQKYLLVTEKGEICIDLLIFAHGGSSQSKLGSDGSLDGIIAKHGYRLLPKRPGLCPIKTVESTKALSGLRHHAKCSLLRRGNTIYEETGEVLFKNDGLSGICIFNLESIWMRQQDHDGFKIAIDLFPEITEQELLDRLARLHDRVGDYYLDSLLVKPLQEYVLFAAKRCFGNDDAAAVASILKHLSFHLKDSYSFDESQVTVGGISLDEVDQTLQSKREPGVFFVGECLNLDGLCGGNNLAWCLLNALIIRDALQ